MSKCISRATALALAATFIDATSAGAAPPQVMNKTISVSFSIKIPARGSDGSAPGTRQVTRLIYVSSQGRLFMRSMRSTRKFGDTKERSPERGTGTLRFVGNRLVGVLPMQSGASQLSVSFDPSYQSCTAEMIMGAESGKAIVWKGLNGVTYTSTGKPSVSGLSCSIQQGNAFAS
ncbi:MAG: hypothetical protein QOJ04_4015 [Caballeronia sp.]|nr:hypothetical protein [Caballeronia sp.]